MSAYTIKKITDILGIDISRTALIKAEDTGSIPTAKREQSGSVNRRTWSIEQIPEIGEKYGSLKRPTRPVVMTFYTTKGGVLKTTLSMNTARFAALHNIKTCVVGLDLQGDVTSALGFDAGLDEADTLDQAELIYQGIHGLNDFERGEKPLMELIRKTDIPTLDFIPETPELAQLDRMIGTKNRREFWLQDQVVTVLQKHYDLIIFDCSPNWNNLVSNAIAASDLLVSPLECKINNYRNYPTFKMYLDAFKKETQLTFAQVCIPTRLSNTRKLSSEIRKWYLTNAVNCLDGAIREGIKGEEAVAKNLSLPEHAPTSIEAQETRDVIKEIWSKALEAIKQTEPATTKNSKAAAEATV